MKKSTKTSANVKNQSVNTTEKEVNAKSVNTTKTSAKEVKEVKEVNQPSNKKNQKGMKEENKKQDQPTKEVKEVKEVKKVSEKVQVKKGAIEDTKKEYLSPFKVIAAVNELSKNYPNVRKFLDNNGVAGKLQIDDLLTDSLILELSEMKESFNASGIEKKERGTFCKYESYKEEKKERYIGTFEMFGDSFGLLPIKFSIEAFYQCIEAKYKLLNNYQKKQLASIKKYVSAVCKLAKEIKKVKSVVRDLPNEKLLEIAMINTKITVEKESEDFVFMALGFLEDGFSQKLITDSLSLEFQKKLEKTLNK